MKTWDANMESMICKIDKFQFVGMMIKREGWQKSICQPSKFESQKAKKRDFQKD